MAIIEKVRGYTSYENNQLLFSGVNFTDLEEDLYESAAIAFNDQENDKSGISLTGLEREWSIWLYCQGERFHHVAYCNVSAKS